jgi:hypothetical protein
VVDGQQLRDRTTGGNSDDVHGSGELVGDRVGVLVGQVVQTGPGFQARCAVDQIHGEPVGQRQKGAQVHPPLRPGGIGVVGADAR